jgi:prolyl-tRNA editing enzyme YbaK/EbsC (Cys-tRNA(Pro) deacylase)
MAACLVLATDRADVNKTVRKHLDVRKISFASMDSAVTRTAMEYGGISPVGLPSDWPVLVDAKVAAGDWLVIGSGIRGSKIAISGSTLATLPGVTVLDLAQPA